MDRRTDKAFYRVACPQLKKKLQKVEALLYIAGSDPLPLPLLSLQLLLSMCSFFSSLNSTTDGPTNAFRGRAGKMEPLGKTNEWNKNKTEEGTRKRRKGVGKEERGRRRGGGKGEIKEE